MKHVRNGRKIAATDPSYRIWNASARHCLLQNSHASSSHFPSTFGLGDHPDTLKNAGSMQVPSWAFSGINSEMCKGKKPWYHGRVSCFLSVSCQTRHFLWPLYTGKDECKTLLLSSPVHAGGRFSSDQSELGTSQAPCTLICLHYVQGIYLCTHC